MAVARGAGAQTSYRARTGSRLLVVRRLGPARLAAASGTYATLRFRVRNDSSDPQRVQGHLELPRGWRLVIPDPAVVLAPHTDELALLRIAIPATAPAGRWSVRYRLAGTAAVDSVTVVVPERRDVECSVRSAPTYVVAGQQYTVAFIVSNDGNGVVELGLAATASDSVPVRLDHTAVRLLPGADVIINADVHPSDSVVQSTTHRVRLVAAVVGDTVRPAPAVSVVPLIPTHVRAVSRFHRVPAQLTLRRVDETGRLSGELQGGGLLTPTGRTSIDFLLRGPGNDVSAFGAQDEYRIDLRNPHYRLQVGDQTYQYSPLGLAGRPGFGADAEMSAGVLTIGASATRDRRAYAYTRESDRTLRLSGQLPLQSLVGLGYRHRDGFDAADVWTAHGMLRPSPGASLEGEYALGRHGGSGGTGYALHAWGSTGVLAYTLRRASADSSLPGTMRGTTSTDGTLTLRPMDAWSLTGSFADERADRPSLRRQQVIGTRRTVEGGVAWGDAFGISLRDVKESGLAVIGQLNGGQLGRSSQSVRLNTGLTLGANYLRGSAEQGTTVLNGATTRYPFRRLVAIGGVNARRQSFSFSVERSTGIGPYSVMDEDRLGITARGALRLRTCTRLSASLSTTRYGRPAPRLWSVLDIGVSQDLAFGHRASWRARSASVGDAGPFWQPQSELDYRMPVALPVGRANDAATVDVHVGDRDANTPLRGALVRLDDQLRVANAHGDATFSGLRSGTHYLEIDPRTLGDGRTTVPGTPLAIALESGEERRIRIAVARAGIIRGVVRRAAPHDDAAAGSAENLPLEDAGPMAGAVVQLTSGADTVRASTDDWGQFTIARVLPGRWELTLPSDGLPPHTRLRGGPLVLDIRASEVRALKLQVVPTRRVEIVAEANLSVTSPAPGVPANAAPERATALATSPRSHVKPEHPLDHGVGAPHRYTVTRWDASLVAIARAMYGDGSLWPRIWLANRWQLADPDELRAGLVLIVPDGGPLTPAEIRARDGYIARSGRAARSRARPPAGWRPPVVRHTYTVTRWDVGLMSVARIMYGDAHLWPKIWLANLDQITDPDVIVAGEVLRVPDPAPLTSRELAARDRYLRGQR